VAKGDTLVGALNGVIGDYLERRRNDLAVDMSLVHGDRPLPIAGDALRQAYPAATPKLCLFLHGLCCTEQSWCYPDAPATTYGSQLQQRCGLTPLFLRYNTGLHISRNGRQLAELLDQLMEAYPTDVAELTLIGHSMGGLLIRSACHYGAELEHSWVDTVRRAIYLGVPHGGAPLEKAGGLVSAVLGPIDEPFTKLTRKLLNLRSDGIKDLRHANLVDQDWEGHDVDASFLSRRVVVPVPDHIEHMAAAGTLTDSDRHLLAQLLGDAIVRVPSAGGRQATGDGALELPAGGFRVFPGLHHMALAHHADVYEQLEAWCGTESATASPAASQGADCPVDEAEATGRAKGVKDLIQDAVEHGSTAVQEVHETVAARPFRILELIPPIRLPVQGVRLVHDAVVRTVYSSIRLANRAVGAVADEVIEVSEKEDEAGAEPEKPTGSPKS